MFRPRRNKLIIVTHGRNKLKKTIFLKMQQHKWLPRRLSTKDHLKSPKTANKTVILFLHEKLAAETECFI